MKKVIRIFLLLILFLFIFSVLTNCRYMYGNDVFTIQNLRYVTHNLFPTCFVSSYSWRADTTDAVIDILNTCEGHYVTSLGGHDVSPFLVNLQGSQYVCNENLLPSDALIEQYHLVINIGESIREAEYIEMDDFHCVGTNQFVQILVMVNCSKENPVFYSEDGKLFRRSDNSLVDGFFYYSDYHDK